MPFLPKMTNFAQTNFWVSYDPLEGWFHRKIFFTIFGPALDFPLDHILHAQSISRGGIFKVIMSEKLCLQWNDFKENVNSAFGSLRNDKEFTDVTIACEDGQQLEARKVIIASSSPFFEKILQKNKHPNPLIYLKGFHLKDFASILDFLYFGEANVYQEDLDSFLAIAEEIQLKGLTGQTSNDLIEDEEKPNLLNL